MLSTALSNSSVSVALLYSPSHFSPTLTLLQFHSPPPLTPLLPSLSSNSPLATLSGRFDLTLPEFVVDQLKLKDVLEPLLALLRSIMSVGKKKPELRTHNIVFVPVGSQEQVLLTSQLKAKFFDFLDENRLMFAVLSGRCLVVTATIHKRSPSHPTKPTKYLSSRSF